MLDSVFTNESTAYRKIDLLHNPFYLRRSSEGRDTAIALEIRSQTLRLLRAIDDASAQNDPKPIWVTKGAVNVSLTKNAESQLERILANDSSLGLFYSYVQLFNLQSGRIASTLSTLGERIVYNDFNLTLQKYIECGPLTAVDDSLDSYGLLGVESFVRQKEFFLESPSEAMLAWFGEPNEGERRPEYSEILDMREHEVVSDVETDETLIDEIDGLQTTLGVDEPMTQADIEANADAERFEIECAIMSDYVASYARENLSPVVARGIIAYRDRGLDAAAAEFKITRAPRKTLTALCKFAAYRFRSGVLIYDNFDQWMMIEDDIRGKIALSMSEIRWATRPHACMVFLMNKDGVPELEEAFASATQVAWDFPNIATLDDYATAHGESYLSSDVVNAWLTEAAPSSVEPITLDSNECLGGLFEAAAGSVELFARMAYAAIEDAASRGDGVLGVESMKVGLEVGREA